MFALNTNPLNRCVFLLWESLSRTYKRLACIMFHICLARQVWIQSDLAIDMDSYHTSQDFK